MMKIYIWVVIKRHLKRPLIKPIIRTLKRPIIRPIKRTLKKNIKGPMILNILYMKLILNLIKTLINMCKVLELIISLFKH